jgi:DNA-binding response OmpR family regulator
MIAPEREMLPEAPVRILVVEDDFDIRLVLTEYLKFTGFDVSSACDGQEAIALISSYQPHLVVLDLMMYPVSGCDVLQWLQAQRRASPLPVLVLTALSSLDQQVQSLEEGAVEFIVKPTQPAMIVERIRALLGLNAEQRTMFRRKRIDEQRSILERVQAWPDEFAS